MKQRNTFIIYPLIILGFVLFFASSCKKDDSIKPPPPEVTETIIETSSATIGVNGGSVVLSDGANVIISSGELSSDFIVTISKIANENIFTAENRYAYDISGLPKGTHVNLIFPCPANKPLKLVGVFNYDPTQYIGTTVSFDYDSINGKVTINNFILQKKQKDVANYSRWIIEWGNNINYGDNTKLIPMPFYQQIGGSCWAASATMLTKAYSPFTGREIETEICEYLRAMNINIDDGIGVYNFMKVLFRRFQVFSGGAGVTTVSYFNKTNLLLAIIKQLDENKPVELYMPNYAHAVLVVGYKTTLNGYDDWELIIHDSKGTNPPIADEGTMYTSRKWSWFLKDAFSTSLFLILYPGTAVHNDRALQTISLPTYPSDNTGVSFEYNRSSGGSSGTISLTWDINKPDGYKWSQSGFTDFDTLPIVKSLNLKLQLYNADLSANQNVSLNVKVYNAKAAKTTYIKDYPITLSNDKLPYYFNLSLDTSEWFKNYGDTSIIEYYIQTRLINNSGNYQDGWIVKFNIKGDKPGVRIETSTVNSITSTKATCVSNIINSGGKTILSRGVCWNTSPIPTISNNKTVDGSGIGTFTSSLTGLTANTNYYVRAYATYASGVAYGNQIEFTTLSLIPILYTGPVENITPTSARCNAIVNSDNGLPVTARGVCWSKVSPPRLPTASDSLTTNGTGTGSYASNITGLAGFTTYYVCAYATNSAGTGYGNTLSFYTTDPIVVGQPYQGGIIAYLLKAGDPGYIAGQKHGLIVAPSDQSTSAQWGCFTPDFSLAGSSDTAFGKGNQNTVNIVNTCPEAGIAAKLCSNLVLGGYSDWYLPSLGEMKRLHQNQSAIGYSVLPEGFYWSSSEYDQFYIWFLPLCFGFSECGVINNSYYAKNRSYKVRAVRSF